MRKIKVVIPVLSANVDNYIRALEKQGVEPVVRHSTEGLETDDSDALLLPGGIDVNPKRYNRENVACGPLSDELDELQLSWLNKFIDEKKPILGICRGHQLINIRFGGTLIQNVENCKRHAKFSLTCLDRFHDAEFHDKDSWLVGIYGNEFTINSAHHQAVEKFGEGLIPQLYSTPDGLVEGSRHTGLPIWSVQWHPERCIPEKTPLGVVDGAKIFEFFTAEIRKRTQL
ncbi:MAG: gamma-glutamyl-gamma-aminobutyrate hydrolase family protein [Lachnospiraceae bacterium]|nr:gamma-glutamyl-gamma-aminobutyrate hydrolase family protein [Lachnospiraceae bacterium]